MERATSPTHIRPPHFLSSTQPDRHAAPDNKIRTHADVMTEFDATKKGAGVGIDKSQVDEAGYGWGTGQNRHIHMAWHTTSVEDTISRKSDHVTKATQRAGRVGFRQPAEVPRPT